MGLISKTFSVVLTRLMRKIEEASLHLVYLGNKKLATLLVIAESASQTCTEFGTHVKTSVPLPVVTPTKTDCLIKEVSIHRVNKFLISLPEER